jgi:hypothetical protein
MRKRKIGDLGEPFRDCTAVAGHPDPDHRLPEEAQLHRVGHRDDLHDPGFGELLHALAHGRLAEPDGLPDLGVRPSTVFLQLLDDGLRHLVEGDRAATWRHAPDSRTPGRAEQVNPYQQTQSATKSAVPGPVRND